MDARIPPSHSLKEVSPMNGENDSGYLSSCTLMSMPGRVSKGNECIHKLSPRDIMNREINGVVKNEVGSIMEGDQVCKEKLEQLIKKAFELLGDKWTRDLGIGILGDLAEKNVLSDKTQALAARELLILLENSDELHDSSLYWSLYVMGEILYDLSVVESSGDAISEVVMEVLMSDRVRKYENADWALTWNFWGLRVLMNLVWREQISQEMGIKVGLCGLALLKSEIRLGVNGLEGLNNRVLDLLRMLSQKKNLLNEKFGDYIANEMVKLCVNLNSEENLISLKILYNLVKAKLVNEASKGRLLVHIHKDEMCSTNDLMKLQQEVSALLQEEKLS